ncbi:MAG: hypothetical protein COA47_03125 [Robiginitomaculum sp.]|nr:MAG: hypothetical protein COA47_03125 [Robiginitomaculum sp.]
MAKSVKKTESKSSIKLIENSGRNRDEIKVLKDKLGIALKRAKLAKSEAAIERLGKVGSSRGVESMFRSSYRAQLDMIALAATKANIMISLNGLLISIILLSGGFLLGAEPLLLIPVASLLLTSTVAIIFAVLAARPEIDNRPRSLEDFTNDTADMLVFGQFTKLNSQEFDSAMWGMLEDQERVYRSMISHIYNLGTIANKKFTKLYVSYNSFMIGLTISVTLLLLVIGYDAFLK